MTSIEMILGVITAGLFLSLFVKFWNAPIQRINESISKVELGLLEGKIKHLAEVIVISDVVEEPTQTLYASVVNNLKRKVKYSFIVSKTNFDNERNKYYQIFKSIAIANDLESSVDIHSLPVDWNSFPCIFYKLTNGYVFAYMGNEREEGIAEGYDFIGPNMAVNLLKLSQYANQIDSKKILSYDQTKEKISLTKEINLN